MCLGYEVLKTESTVCLFVPETVQKQDPICTQGPKLQFTDDIRGHLPSLIRDWLYSSVYVCNDTYSSKKFLIMWWTSTSGSSFLKHCGKSNTNMQFFGASPSRVMSPPGQVQHSSLHKQIANGMQIFQVSKC